MFSLFDKPIHIDVVLIEQENWFLISIGTNAHHNALMVMHNVISRINHIVQSMIIKSLNFQ